MLNDCLQFSLPQEVYRGGLLCVPTRSRSISELAGKHVPALEFLPLRVGRKTTRICGKNDPGG